MLISPTASTEQPMMLGTTNVKIVGENEDAVLFQAGKDIGTFLTSRPETLR